MVCKSNASTFTWVVWYSYILISRNLTLTLILGELSTIQNFRPDDVGISSAPNSNFDHIPTFERVESLFSSLPHNKHSIATEYK